MQVMFSQAGIWPPLILIGCGAKPGRRCTGQLQPYKCMCQSIDRGGYSIELATGGHHRPSPDARLRCEAFAGCSPGPSHDYLHT
jgi:hypothetical protein